MKKIAKGAKRPRVREEVETRNLLMRGGVWYLNAYVNRMHIR